jgi:hypothetical protein
MSCVYFVVVDCCFCVCCVVCCEKGKHLHQNFPYNTLLLIIHYLWSLSEFRRMVYFSKPTAYETGACALVLFYLCLSKESWHRGNWSLLLMLALLLSKSWAFIPICINKSWWCSAWRTWSFGNDSAFLRSLLFYTWNVGLIRQLPTALSPNCDWVADVSSIY